MVGNKKPCILHIPQKFGVELELTSTTTEVEHMKGNPDPLERWQQQGDGSIRVEKRNHWAAEMVSVPINVTQGMAPMNEAIEWLYKEMPHISTNDSCGLHVHVSYPDAKGFHLLYDSDFGLWYTNRLKTSDVEVIKKYAQCRLDNHFCHAFANKKDWRASKKMQLMSGYKDGSRYKTVNFNPLHHHDAIEFRSFMCPDNAKETKEILAWLYETLVEYSASQPMKKFHTRKHNIDADDSSVDVVEIKKEKLWAENEGFVAPDQWRDTIPTRTNVMENGRIDHHGIERRHDYSCAGCGTGFDNTIFDDNDERPDLCNHCFENIDNDNDDSTEEN